MDTDRQNYELKIVQLQQMLAHKEEEVRSLYELSDKRRIENEQLQQRFEQVQVSSSVSSSSSSELKMLKEQYNTVMYQVQDAIKSRDLYKVELEKLNKKYQEAMGVEMSPNSRATETVTKSYVVKNQQY